MNLSFREHGRALTLDDDRGQADDAVFGLGQVFQEVFLRLQLFGGRRVILGHRVGQRGGEVVGDGPFARVGVVLGGEHRRAGEKSR